MRLGREKEWFVTKYTNHYFVLNNFKLFSNPLLNVYGNTNNFVHWKLAYKKWVLHNSIRVEGYRIDSFNEKTIKKQESNRINVNKISYYSNSIVKSTDLNGYMISFI